METMETPTQMTTGVAQNVGAQTTSFGSETDMHIENGIPDGVFEEQTSHSEFISESQEIPDQVRDDDKPLSNSSDLLLQSAKEDGFEEALDRLANGDFEDETENTGEEQENVISEDSQEVEELNEEADEEVLEIPEDEIPLSEQISILEGEVEVLKEETLRLSEKIKSIDNTQKIPIEAVLGLLALLQKLAEEEKDEEKKVSILEVLVNFLVFFMKETFVPNDGSEKTQAVEKVAPKKKSKVSSEQILEVLKMFKNQNAKDTSQTPHIEKQAA